MNYILVDQKAMDAVERMANGGIVEGNALPANQDNAAPDHVEDEWESGDAPAKLYERSRIKALAGIIRASSFLPFLPSTNIHIITQFIADKFF